MSDVIKWLGVEFKYVHELEQNIAHAKEHLGKLLRLHKNMEGILKREKDAGGIRERDGEKELLKQLRDDLKQAFNKLRYASNVEYKANQYEDDLKHEFTTLGVPIEYQKDFHVAQNKLINELSTHTGELWRTMVNLNNNLLMINRHLNRGKSFESIKVIAEQLIKLIKDFEKAIINTETWISSLTATMKEIEEKRRA